MPMKEYVCRDGDCWRSYHTEKGREYHEERIHDGDIDE